jgi:hypothetical protein
MPDQKAIIFAQSIEALYEIKAWGFDLDAEKNLCNLVIHIFNRLVKNYSETFALTIRKRMKC